MKRKATCQELMEQRARNGWPGTSEGPSDLFRRTVDQIVVPFAKAGGVAAWSGGAEA
jgi:hypothetical protein